MKRIAVIGANSYIARNLILTLRTNNQDEQFDLCLYDYAERQADGFDRYTQINVLDAESVKQIDMNCDIVFMFVGKTGAANGFDEFNSFIDINERALLNVLNEYRRQKSKAKIVFPSTRLVYKGSDMPLHEDAAKEFKTIYAVNKWACENYLMQYHNVFGVNYCIFRICVPYGTMIDGAASYGTAEFMMKKASAGEDISLYGDGAVRRTLTFMGDLCNVLIRGALSDECLNDVFNIGGEDYSLKEMAELIAAKYSVNVVYIPYPEVAEKIESGSTVFNSVKLENIISSITNKKFADWIDEQKI